MLNAKTVFFSDNFFSAGRTDILNDQKEKIGEIDLKSAFSSSIDVLDLNGVIVVNGKFPVFGNRWKIYNQSNREIGEVKVKFTFLAQKYEYQVYGGKAFTIQAEPFSRKYEIFNDHQELIAKFAKVSGFFSAAAFQLSSFTEEISVEELVAVVMGVNAIQKRRNSSASSSV